MKYRNLSHSLDIMRKISNREIGKINVLFALWWGVKLGRHISFEGKCHFYRFPKSQILIGDGCTFLSKPFSNRIGINRACMISTQTANAKIEIGDNCGFSGTGIGAFKYIKLGRSVRCGANTLITDADWHLDDPRSGEPADVIIEDYVWLGEGVKVLKGVRIGKNSVIGAGSVVTKNIPEGVVAAGNPCVEVKNLYDKNE